MPRARWSAPTRPRHQALRGGTRGAPLPDAPVRRPRQRRRDADAVRGLPRIERDPPMSPTSLREKKLWVFPMTYGGARGIAAVWRAPGGGGGGVPPPGPPPPAPGAGPPPGAVSLRPVHPPVQEGLQGGGAGEPPGGRAQLRRRLPVGRAGVSRPAAARGVGVGGVAARGEPRPLIGVVGEIFCRLNAFSNQAPLRRLERAGGEAWLSDVGE